MNYDLYTANKAHGTTASQDKGLEQASE